MRKIIIVTGQMGAGKTTLCKKIRSNNMLHFPRPFFYVSVDVLAKEIRNHFFSLSNHQWKYFLFLHPHKKKYWHYLEQTVHPLVSTLLDRIMAGHRKGTLLIDIALMQLLPSQKKWDRVFIIPSRPIFPTLRMLKKERNMPFYQAIALMQKQKKQGY